MVALKIGILALQGAYQKHADMIALQGALPVLVKHPSDLESCSGLIIPGGESTTISNRIDFIDFRENLKRFAEKKPVFGTCAGLILMANTSKDSLVEPLSFLDIEVLRNAFGRQSESFTTSINVVLEEKPAPFHAVFIRAPKIQKVGPKVKVLAYLQEDPVLVQQGFHLAATFHPELSKDARIHAYFLKLVNAVKSKGSCQT